MRMKQVDHVGHRAGFDEMRECNLGICRILSDNRLVLWRVHLFLREECAIDGLQSAGCSALHDTPTRRVHFTALHDPPPTEPDCDQADLRRSSEASAVPTRPFGQTRSHCAAISLAASGDASTFSNEGVD